MRFRTRGAARLYLLATRGGRRTAPATLVVRYEGTTACLTGAFAFGDARQRASRSLFRAEIPLVRIH